MMVTRLQVVQQNVAAWMEKIVEQFKPGVKITVIVRTPGHPDRDFVMTDDALYETIAVLERRAAASEVPRPARREADLSPRAEDTSPSIIPGTTVKGETL